MGPGGGRRVMSEKFRECRINAAPIKSSFVLLIAS